MEKEDLMKVIHQKEFEKEGFEVRYEFFEELIELGELSGRNLIDAERDMEIWEAAIEQ